MRLFLALGLPPALRTQVDERLEPLRRRLPPARWVPRRQLHVTLVFLGDVDPTATTALGERLGEAFAPGPSLALRLARPDAFPRRGPVRVLWSGAVEATGELQRLRARASAAVEATLPSFVPDPRPYRPHLTLARCRPPWPRTDLARLRRGWGDGPSQPFTVTEGVLVASTLTPSGAVHRPLATYPLGTGAV